MALNREQVSLIENEVNKACIQIEDLKSELIDHICCEVEALISNGKSFEEAFSIVKREATVPVLKSIEECTRELIDKKFKLMKNTMRITGNVSLLFIAVGTVMKIFSVSGASIVLTLAFAIFCLIFMPLTIYNYRNKRELNCSNSFKWSLMFAGILFLIGILFKTMQWNGANIILGLSFLTIILIVIPSAAFDSVRSENRIQSWRLNFFGFSAFALFVCGLAFKMFHFPAASLLLATSVVMLITIFLPLYSYYEFKKTQSISLKFIYIIICSMYIITMVMLMSFSSQTQITHLLTTN